MTVKRLFGASAVRRRTGRRNPLAGLRQNGAPVHPITDLLLSIIGTAVGLALLSVPRSIVGSLGTYLVGAVITLLAWLWDSRWNGVLWIVGVLVFIYGIATMVLMAQVWLAGAAFTVLLAVLIYPPIARQTHEEVRRRREQNRR